jgi:hypothetical protein
MTDDELVSLIGDIVVQLPKEMTQREICSLFATILMAYEMSAPKRVFLLGMVETTIRHKQDGKAVKFSTLNLRKH